MERLGFGYEDLKRDHPGLIYCSLSGFGRTGPYKDRRGFDLVAQAMSGIMSFTGEAGRSARRNAAPPLSDITAGILAAMGILAAYAHRLKTGEGQWVETSLFEAALVQTYWQSAIALATGVAPQGHGLGPSAQRPLPGLRGLRTAGSSSAAPTRRTGCARSTRSVRPNSRGIPRFRTGADRMAHLTELEAELAAALPHPARRALARRPGPEGRALRARQRHAAGADRSRRRSRARWWSRSSIRRSGRSRRSACR